MTASSQERTAVASDPDAAAVTHAVLDAALDAARDDPDDPWPEWRVRTLRRTRSLVGDHLDGTWTVGTVEMVHVATALDVCHAMSPTPHERIEHESIRGDEHPNYPYGEAAVALTRYIGDALPDVPLGG